MQIPNFSGESIDQKEYVFTSLEIILYFFNNYVNFSSLLCHLIKATCLIFKVQKIFTFRQFCNLCFHDDIIVAVWSISDTTWSLIVFGRR